VTHLDDARDVRVIEQRADARLVEKHPHELIVRGEVRQDALDHDQRAQARQLARQRQEGFRHPALRQPPDQTVPSDAGVRRIARLIMVVRWSNHSHLISSIQLLRANLFAFLRRQWASVGDCERLSYICARNLLEVPPMGDNFFRVPQTRNEP
jgi:hypothetical protein